MSRVHFDRGAVEQLLDHAEASPGHQVHHGQADGPALFLVAQVGIFLMSNGLPRQVLPGRHEHEEDHVVYARECDPRTMLNVARCRAQLAIVGDNLIMHEWFSALHVRGALETLSPGMPLAVEIDPDEVSLCITVQGMIRRRRGQGFVERHEIGGGEIAGVLHHGRSLVRMLSPLECHFLKGSNR